MTTKRDWENILYTAELRGEEKGIAIGEARGKHNALIATARRMVQVLGYTAEEAAEATGLSPEQFLDS
jgi:hypothetical protein